MQQLRSIADENELMLIFDEVQNGVGLSGKFWACEHFKVKPDILAFGKKMQVCGIIANGRVDEIEDNCFAEKGRLNSTWGGSLTDMVRATKILRIIDDEQLVSNASVQGSYLLEGLQKLEKENLISRARGRGLQCAFDLPSTEARDKFLERALTNKLLLGSCGDKSIRFRPALIVQKTQIDEGLEILRTTLKN
jgi:L-lysine 6-transaminase